MRAQDLLVVPAFQRTIKIRIIQKNKNSLPKPHLHFSHSWFSEKNSSLQFLHLFQNPHIKRNPWRELWFHHSRSSALRFHHHHHQFIAMVAFTRSLTVDSPPLESVSVLTKSLRFPPSTLPWISKHFSPKPRTSYTPSPTLLLRLIPPPPTLPLKKMAAGSVSSPIRWNSFSR